MEEKFENNEKKKKNKGIIILIIVLVISVIAVIGSLLYDKYVISNKSEENKIDTKKSTKKESEKDLDLTKALNGENITYTNPKLLTNTDDAVGLTININSDKKTATLSIDWAKFGPISTASTWANDIVNVDVKGFNKNIKDAFVGGIGQDAMGTKLFFIMEDQTVEYIDIFEGKIDSMGNSYYEMGYTYDRDYEGKITSEYFKSKGKIQNIEGIVKLYEANATGYYTVLAKKMNGSFYNLGEIISN